MKPHEIANEVIGLMNKLSNMTSTKNSEELDNEFDSAATALVLVMSRYLSVYLALKTNKYGADLEKLMTSSIIGIAQVLESSTHDEIKAIIEGSQKLEESLKKGH